MTIREGFVLAVVIIFIGIVIVLIKAAIEQYF